MRCHAYAIALLAAVSGCDPGAAEESDSLALGSSDEASSTDAVPPDACSEACGELASEVEIAVCQACRCKLALDDWLPTVDELQCGNAERIVVYHADVSAPEVVLEPAPPSATHCANPSLFTGSCRQGSRLGRIRHGNAAFYWICRDPYLGLDGSVVYEDMAAIGHNVRTGATCFWDDVDDRTHDDDLPSFDLADATEAARSEFAARFNFTDGTVCVTCHDHDPFLYTPYLQSTGWQSLAAEGPYARLDLAGNRRATGNQHLVSPEAEPCTACHRIGSGNTCARFVRDALATDKASAYETEVLAAAEPGSPHWKLAYWMPSANLSVPDFATWLSAFADAREHILRCCELPGEAVDGCVWEPVRAE